MKKMIHRNAQFSGCPPKKKRKKPETDLNGRQGGQLIAVGAAEVVAGRRRAVAVDVLRRRRAVRLGVGRDDGGHLIRVGFRSSAWTVTCVDRCCCCSFFFSLKKKENRNKRKSARTWWTESESEGLGGVHWSPAKLGLLGT